MLKPLEKIKLSKESTSIVDTLLNGSPKALEKIKLSKRLTEITALLMGSGSQQTTEAPSVDLSPFEAIVNSNEITLDTLGGAIASTKQILDRNLTVPSILLQAAEVVSDKLNSESFFDSMTTDEKNDFLKMSHELSDLLDPEHIESIEINDVLAQTADTSAISTADPSQQDLIDNNYQTGKIKINGLNIAIENPIGSVRSGTSSSGVEWQTEMTAHYGYIEGTKGADGDEVDVFVLPGISPAYIGTYFVIFQNDENGNFDEHKVIIGAPSRIVAAQVYREHYDEQWSGMGQIVEYSYEGLLQFLEDLKHETDYSTGAFYDAWSADGVYEFVPVSKIITENAPDLKEAKISREDPIVVYERMNQYYMVHGHERIALAETRKERMVPCIIFHDEDGINWQIIKAAIRRAGSPVDPVSLGALLQDEVEKKSLNSLVA
ncbi:hypothetical protein [Acinetobacter sp. CFCC 10889]|uniref:hypothetical protein n=1 Tax=Acinetobacter sp. CFCC 10889 TaxID=1775557 RepID=UPI000DCFDE28|nr:hypothetical protein [Acinetobacter sp. CFCC 10889]